MVWLFETLECKFLNCDGQASGKVSRHLSPNPFYIPKIR